MRKSAALFALVLVAVGSTVGCESPRTDFGSTPAYSSAERGRLIGRAWNYEGAQAMDDIDHALLLRPASRLTLWHVR